MGSKKRLDSENSTLSQDTTVTILSEDSCDGKTGHCSFRLGESPEEEDELDSDLKACSNSSQSRKKSAGHVDDQVSEDHYESVGGRGPESMNVHLYRQRQFSLPDYRAPQPVPRAPRARTYSGNFLGTVGEGQPFIDGFEVTPATPSSGYASVYGDKKVNKLNNEVELLLRNHDRLIRSCKQQKRVTIVLAVFNLILIVCVLVIVPVFMVTQTLGSRDQPLYPYSDTRDHSYDPGEDVGLQPSADITDQLCVSCTLFDQYANKITVTFDERDGLCCLQSVADIISVIKTITRVETLSIIHEYLQKLPFRNGNATYLRPPPRVRPAIHLKSDAIQDSKSWQKLRWRDGQDLQVQGYLGLSLDKTSVIVPSDGYYYIYSRVHFAREGTGRTGNFTLHIRLYLQRGGNEEAIETARQRCFLLNGTIEHNSHLESVVSLKKGDRIYISVSNAEFLDRTLESHTFGLFEI